MTSVRELHEWLTGRRPMIAVVDDPFAEAWSTSDDLDGMIELLWLGGRVGVFEIDATRMWGKPPERWLFRLRTPEGRYVRVDVRRADGPDGLRAIVPNLPPLAAWRDATDATEAARDPLAQYLLDVSHRGRPSAAWSARWGEGDAGLRVAWAASSDSVSMRRVLQATGRDEAAARAQAAVLDVPVPPRGDSFVSPDGEAMRRYQAALVEAVRRAVPAPFG
ncbi:MAG: hypothetical protein R3B99_02560 [Polyangiales bacterium]|nr:hypothetical protein [Myxococcales bacterium]MCB9600722.1 hypothetical protein [Sandaracinus sp.]